MTPEKKIIPTFYRKLYGRCVRGEASPREAIKCQCLECYGWVRSETAACDNAACPLWRYRPYQGAAAGRQGDFCDPESTNGSEGV